MLSILPAFLVALVPDTLLPGGELCDDVGICIGGVCVGLVFSILAVAVAVVAVRERDLARDAEKPAARVLSKQRQDLVEQPARTTASAHGGGAATPQHKHGKGGVGVSRRSSPEFQTGAADAQPSGHAAEVGGAGGAGRVGGVGVGGGAGDTRGEAHDLKRVMSANSNREDVELLERRCAELEAQIRSDCHRRGERECGDGELESEREGAKDRDRDRQRERAREFTLSPCILQGWLVMKRQTVLRWERREGLRSVRSTRSRPRSRPIRKRCRNSCRCVLTRSTCCLVLSRSSLRAA